MLVVRREGNYLWESGPGAVVGDLMGGWAFLGGGRVRGFGVGGKGGCCMWEGETSPYHGFPHQCWEGRVRGRESPPTPLELQPQGLVRSAGRQRKGRLRCGAPALCC